MQIECPPPKVLWEKLLERCSQSDLALLRDQTMITISRLDEHTSVDTDNECRAFLREISREAGRRITSRRSISPTPLAN